MRHSRFDWDARKAADAEARPRHISFDFAMYVLMDPDGDIFHVELPDESHSGDEERWMTLASVPDDRNTVVAIVWTQWLNEIGEVVTRIISARRATKSERRDYEKRIFPFH